jgi:hypothetical protein
LFRAVDPADTAPAGLVKERNGPSVLVLVYLDYEAPRFPYSVERQLNAATGLRA